ncbi:hypothetical protein [Streptomyces sp. CB02460]|uniref:hypothetical protein n=1 Tax=Streptomyces sp. CB02460 TaxID=1703941 RepID=UPI000B04B29B|nr:hypothetical protein [Streptomyces sp. CB02460]
MAQDAGWGGWGGGGWAPPKPGVIPLGPLKLGDIFNGAFSTLGRYWKQLLAVGATLYGGALVLVGVAVAVAYGAVSDHLDRLFALEDGESAPSGDVVPVIVAFGVVVLLGFLAMVIASAVVYAAVPAVLQDAVLGRPTTFSAVWRRAWARTPAVIGTLLLVGLITMVPMVLAVGALTAGIIAAIATDGGGSAVALIVVGAVCFLAFVPLVLWLWVRLALAPATAVFENQGPMASLRRSALLVRGDWWRIFGIMLLASVIASTVGYIIQLPFNLLGMFTGALGTTTVDEHTHPAAIITALGGYLVLAALGQLVGQLVVAVFPPLVTGLLYVDRRIRTENLAPVLAEAASVPPPYAP